MINFQKLDSERRAEYDRYLLPCSKGCEYSFVNLSIWGRQRAAFVDGFLVLRSQFDRRSVYPFPVGHGDILPVLEAIIRDAKERGITCCFTGMNQEECDLLEKYYPGKFRIQPDRNGFDYIYSIDDLADLKGRKFQKKRNHLNRFRENHPNWRTEPISIENLPAVREMAESWYARRHEIDPHGSYTLEQIALERALSDPKKLGLEGLTLMDGDQLLAFTLASRMSEDTYDVHFEKAREDVDGAYTAINQQMAFHLREKHPELRFLDREDDMGLEGLRKAKLSYNPVRLVEKYWARLWEEDDED
jgi:hypothetical protein